MVVCDISKTFHTLLGKKYNIKRTIAAAPLYLLIPVHLCAFTALPREICTKLASLISTRGLTLPW